MQRIIENIISRTKISASDSAEKGENPQNIHAIFYFLQVARSEAGYIAVYIEYDSV